MTDRLSASSALGLAKSAASSNGLSLSSEGLAAAAERIAAGLVYQEGALIAVTPEGSRAIEYVNGEVRDVEAGAFIVGIARELATPTKTKREKAQHQSATPKGGIAALRAGLAADREAAAQRQAVEVAQVGNPWLPGRINRTAQAVITRNNPELASRYKAEAGVHDFKYNWRKR
ncbi:hypothetical protein [Methylorubrum aminovorans]